MNVTVTGSQGDRFSISDKAYLSANGKKYSIKKVSEFGLNKDYVMPDSGKVHFVMEFEPLPSDTKLMHFSEGISNGWRLCNIRNGEDGLKTDLPDEWKNVGYAQNEELPDTKLCDDSTTIRIKILNYTPEAAKTINLFFNPFDFDQEDCYRKVSINENGDAHIKLHLCFPMTVQMCLEGGKYSPLLLVPGKDTEILMDLGKGGTDCFAAFKGTLAKTNYELNVQNGKKLVSPEYDTAYFDSLLYVQYPYYDFFNRLNRSISDINASAFCNSTKEWLSMYAEYLFLRKEFDYYLYAGRKIGQELENSGSEILQNSIIKRKLLNAVKKPAEINVRFRFMTSPKMTFCPYYPDAWMFAERNFTNTNGVENTYNKDIQTLYLAISRNKSTSYEDGLQMAETISDPNLKAYYTVASRRWQQFVEEINSTPHMHFDKHNGLDNNKLKENILEEHKGKYVVFLLYENNTANTAQQQDLQALDEIIRKTDNQKIVFIHINTYLLGTQKWHEAALGRSGEHYGGYKVRYSYMFPNMNPQNIYYEIYSPEGKNILQTEIKGKAFKTIENIAENQ